METIPSTYKAWRRTAGALPLSITQSTESLPAQLKENEVLLRIHTVSLNYRDAAMLYGKYPRNVLEKGIPTSDCAAEVIAVGPAVRAVAVDDRVIVNCDLNYEEDDERGAKVGLGADVEGVLKEYAVYDQSLLIKAPAHLSWEELSLIPCAAVTAWNALRFPRLAGPGNTAFLQGTGGVSMCALLLCLAAGVYPIITSSSDDKLREIQKLAEPGRIGTINYRTQNIDDEVKKLTGGQGVDVVVNNIGPSSVVQDIGLLRRNGTISIVGFLGGWEAMFDGSFFGTVLQKCATIVGIYIGSRKMIEALCTFLDEKKVDLNPLLDRTFKFSEAKEAFDYLYEGKHVGKVVIQVS